MQSKSLILMHGKIFLIFPVAELAPQTSKIVDFQMLSIFLNIIFGMIGG